MHLAQLGFEDQAIERRAHFVGDDRHEIVAHAYRMLQLTACHLQLGQQQFLFLPAVFQGFELAAEHLALAEQVDEHRHLALHRQDIEWLVQKVHCPALVALEGVVHLAPRGTDENDRNVLGLLGATHQLGQLEAIHARHLHIENGQGEFVLQHQRQGLFGRLGLMHLAVFALDQRVEGQQVFRQVVDDQQFGDGVA
ncbi:hypothetical protein D3C76_1279120 [compost metagenome]